MPLREHESSVIFDYHSGMGICSIAQKYGVTYNPVYRFLKRRQIKFRDNSVLCNKLDVIADYKSGSSSREVAKKYRISSATVLRIRYY